MTISDIKSLTDDQLRVKLAEALGIKCDKCGSVDCSYVTLPNWPADLNACHEAESNLPEGRFVYFCAHLKSFLMSDEGVSDWDMIHSSARQRSEALLATLTKGEK